MIHDSSLRRVCGEGGSVENLTAAELGRYRLEGTDEKIPFLDEVLPIFEGRTPLVVEIKPANGNWDVLTAKTVECLDRFQVRYCMESFDPRSLLWLKKHRPEIVRGQLTQNFLKDPAGLGFKNRFLLTMGCFDGKQFGLCGKTIGSLRRNLLQEVLPYLRQLGFHLQKNRTDHRLTVRFGGRENQFLLFGGRDESSAALIQGSTLAGVLLDEVALM